MKCPVDNTDLVMSDRQGVEIDYCPRCRGVWLDRGELDKIIERSTTIDRQYESEYESQHHDDRHGHHDNDHDYKQNQHGRKQSRGAWLGELFGGD